MKKALLLVSILGYSLTLQASKIDEIWKNMSSKSIEEIRTDLRSAASEAPLKVDAILTTLLLNSLEGTGDNLSEFKALFPELDNPSPYLFSLWFESAVVEDYGKLESERLSFLESFPKNPKVNGSILSSLNYVLAMHYISSNNFTYGRNYWDKVECIRDWQYLGVFDNTVGSGFDKDYAPINEPDANAVFKSAKNADISWFVPEATQADPWVSPKEHFSERQGITYFQSFVKSDSEQEVILSMGAGGSLKVWVNDVLVIAEETERMTDMDVFKRKVKLNSGYNRVLVQVGFTHETSYPNFILRFVDEDGYMVKGLSSTEKNQSYQKADESSLGDVVPHFSQTFFKKKIETNPDNGLNYVLLTKAYMRNRMIDEAMEVIQNGLDRFPNNPIMQVQLLEILSEQEDRTKLLSTIEEIRSSYPDLYFFDIYDFRLNMNNEDYQKAEENLLDISRKRGADSQLSIDYKIELSSARKDYQEMFELIEKGYAMYPENSKFVLFKFSVEKSKGASTKKTLAILQNYLKTNYSDRIFKVLKKEYKEAKSYKKMEKLMITRHNEFPESYDFSNDLALYYYDRGEYFEARKYIDKAIGSTPYYSQLWLNRAYINLGIGDLNSAIRDLQKAIEYDPNQFSAREILREIQEKDPLSSLIYEDREEAIKKIQMEDISSEEDNYRYIHHEVNQVIYPEGSSIAFDEYAIQMLNETGAEYWQETSIPINPYSQRLIVTKADVLKKNGEKIAAERNYNELVFPTLEVGDVIHISYRRENYTGGKLAKEFWCDHIFNDFVPVEKSVFRLYTPKDYDIHYEQKNFDVEATIKDVDDFKLYEWVLESPEKCDIEDYMPNLLETGICVHFSTLNEWEDISTWYSDLAIPRANEDYNIDQTYQEIFKDKGDLSQREKAELIYTYLSENIKYSSVSFRQSSFVPQKPRKTISTQLGDCKDMSTLYHALANKAGIKTNLVLVNTRDNGENSLTLPSIGFNHCIIKIDLDEGTLFQELTDNTLPFGAMPNSIMNAQALVIPNSGKEQAGDLINIPNTQLIRDEYTRNSTVVVDGSDLKISTSLKAEGYKASLWRRYFDGISKSDLKEAVTEIYKDDFESDLEVDTFKLVNQDNLAPYFEVSGEFTVDGEVKSIGGLQAIKPPLFGPVVDISDLQKDDRQHPFNFWSYHSTDNFETTTTVKLPEGSQIMDLPKNFEVSSPHIFYSITFKELPDNVVEIKRVVKPKRNNIEAKDYAEFRGVVKKISAAEDVYIAFK